MPPPDIRETLDALAQVDRLREVVADRARFHGYSGGARLVGGLAALAAGGVLAAPFYPPTPAAQLAGWAAVLAVGLVVNYGALLRWFLRAPGARRELFRLRPAWDAVPPLAAAAILSLAAVRHESHDLLFGIWMCGYAVVHAAYRRNLPAANYLLGAGYMIAGAACLLLPAPFINPWPMALTFFVGETIGGAIFIHDARRQTPPADPAPEETA